MNRTIEEIHDLHLGGAYSNRALNVVAISDDELASAAIRDSELQTNKDIYRNKTDYHSKIKLHPDQEKVSASPARFKVVVCGRRWGKTEFGKHLSISLADQGKHVWWILPNYPMAVDTWHDIKRTFNGDYAEKQEQFHIIRTHNGGILRIRTASDMESLKGSGLDHAIFDETASTSKQIWTESIRPSLSDKKGGATFLGTPKGVMNWFYELFGLGLNPEMPDWECWNLPTWTNPFIDPDEIEQARRLLPSSLFDQEYGAKFTSNAGLIYDNFDMSLNVSARAEYAPDEPVYWAVDDGYAYGGGEGTEGYHPRVILFYHITALGGVDVFDERYATGESKYDETIDAALERYPAPYVAYVDSSAAMLRGALTLRGIPNAGATHVVTEGIKNVRRMICDGNGTPLLRIHPRCVNLIKEMQLYTYHDTSLGPNGERKPAKMNDHGPDALRYGTYHLRYGA